MVNGKNKKTKTSTCCIMGLELRYHSCLTYLSVLQLIGNKPRGKLFMEIKIIYFGVDIYSL